MPPHDHLFKSLFRAFFRELLLLVDAQLAARLSPGQGLDDSSRAVQRVQAITSTEELGSLAERLLTAGALEELGLA